MPKAKNKEQKRRRKVEAKRKRLRQRNSPAGIAERALRHPIRECWISANWPDPAALTQILVARPMNDRGELAFMSVLVDRMCLGAKNGYLRTGFSAEFHRHLEHMDDAQLMQQCEPALAAKVARAGLDYAESLGFGPHPDAAEGLALLDNVDPGDCDEPIEVGGPEGKPMYVAGPRDDVVQIMTRLSNRLGPDGFHYMIAAELWSDLHVRRLVEDGHVVEPAQTGV